MATPVEITVCFDTPSSGKQHDADANANTNNDQTVLDAMDSLNKKGESKWGRAITRECLFVDFPIQCS